ncbi:MAG: 30S ribosomal protein S16 [Flavobacteriaceae bacterium]|jgi:small subunit ribosomal protein S16|nr:30S ribosomal protein S16 [Flavobacteriaceae bacterium]
MSVKIRLQRHGKKGKPFFHIVVADSRAKRDGKFIEKLGIYNPVTNPATIELNVDSAVKWLNNGAQPSDTARAILSYKGALYKKHLQGGVAKGAFDEAEAEKRFNEWLETKESKIQGKTEGLAQSKAKAKKAALEAESKVKEARIAAAAQTETPVETVAETVETPEVENAVEEVAEVVEETVAEIAETETPVAEVVEGSAAEETAETPVETVAKPAEETVAENAETETPAADEENTEA